MGDDDAGFVVVLEDVLGEFADFCDAEFVVGEKLDPDGAAVGDGVGIGFGCGWCIFSEHGFARSGRELKSRTAVY